jgi:hypothetical protein
MTPPPVTVSNVRASGDPHDLRNATDREEPRMGCQYRWDFPIPRIPAGDAPRSAWGRGNLQNNGEPTLVCGDHHPMRVEDYPWRIRHRHTDRRPAALALAPSACLRARGQFHGIFDWPTGFELKHVVPDYLHHVISEIHLAYATCETSQGIFSRNHSCAKNTTKIMGNFNRGYATGLQGKWLQAGITLCSAWAFTLFG